MKKLPSSAVEGQERRRDSRLRMRRPIKATLEYRQVAAAELRDLSVTGASLAMEGGPGEGGVVSVELQGGFDALVIRGQVVRVEAGRLNVIGLRWQTTQAERTRIAAFIEELNVLDRKDEPGDRSLRIHLRASVAVSFVGRLKSLEASLVDLSLKGARIQVPAAFAPKRGDGATLRIGNEVLRGVVRRVAVKEDGVYAGVEFVEIDRDTARRIMSEALTS